MYKGKVKTYKSLALKLLKTDTNWSGYLARTDTFTLTPNSTTTYTVTHTSAMDIAYEGEVTRKDIQELYNEKKIKPIQ